MKNFIAILITVLLCFSCGLSKKSQQTINQPKMLLLIDANFNKHQFDSLCVADTLPNDLEKWLRWQFIDYEKNTMINEYVYIKHINEDEVMYRLIIDNDYNIMKRLTDR